MVDAGVDINDVYHGQYILFWAIRQKNGSETVKVLLDAGADPNKDTFLITAILERNTKAAKLLLDAGVDPNQVSSGDRSALMWAAQRGNTEIVRLLLDKGAKVRENNAAMIKAVTVSPRGHRKEVPEIVKMLIEHGADVNTRFPYKNWTLLMFAVDNGFTESVKILLANGADAGAKDKDGKTALDLAKEKGRGKIVKLLESHKPVKSPMVADNKKTEPVRLASESASRDAEPDEDINWDLIRAARKGNMGEVKALVKKGAYVNYKSKSGLTPIYSASGKGQLDVVKFLIAKGADVNARHMSGWTPLTEASRGGHAGIVKILLAEGADPNAESIYTRETALMLAAQEGHEDIAEMLIRGGADIGREDNKGKTALDKAEYHGHEKVADLIKKAASSQKKKKPSIEILD